MKDHSPFIGLLTDFGLSDTYVGVMKAVMHGICPDARFVDLTHDVPPQNLWSAAYLLFTALPYLPDDAVLLAVVDPGVGSRRRAIAVELGEWVIVCPDNGIVDLVAQLYPIRRAFELDPNLIQPGRRISSTFHGRDVFAPAAARIAGGEVPAAVGLPIDPDELAGLELPRVQESDHEVTCVVAHIDHFGNLITNCRAEHLTRLVDSETSRRVDEIPLARTFDDVADGELVAYVGSSGFIEIAVRNGSAEERLGAMQADGWVLRRAGQIVIGPQLSANATLHFGGT